MTIKEAEKLKELLQNKILDLVDEFEEETELEITEIDYFKTPMSPDDPDSTLAKGVYITAEII